jgi:hypothetical protein
MRISTVEALCGIKTAVFTAQWGGRVSNPRPEDYEDFRPKRFAVRRDERWMSERSASNTSLLKGGESRSATADFRRSRSASLALAGTSMTTKESPCPNHPLSSCWPPVGSTEVATQSRSNSTSRPDLPAFILLCWPEAPSVCDPNPKALAAVAASMVRIQAEAQARLAEIRSKRP